MNKFNYKLLTHLLFFTFLSSCSASENNHSSKEDYEKFIVPNDKNISRPSILEVSKIIKSHFIIGFSWVDSPLNKIILIRNASTYCAVKFIDINRGRDSKVPTAFNSGSESFYAEYEFYEQLNSIEPDLQITRKKVSDLSSVGVGRLAFSRDNNIITCGTSRLFWGYPTAIFIAREDNQTRLAVSSFSEFKNIDFLSKELNWYGFKENREYRTIKK